MLVVSWNMGCAGNRYKPSHDEAWRYLVEELRPDVALVQEALLTPPLVLAGSGRFFARGAWEKQYGWGSGVYVPSLPSTEVAAITCEGVHAVAAQIETPSGRILTTSVHVGTSGDQAARLSMLADALAQELLSGRACIVAGDFNAARHYDDVYGTKLYRTFFQKMSASGFFECHWSLHGRETQSFWGGRTREPYQDDHFFVNEALGPKVTSCEIVDNGIVRRLSDHGPVRMNIDL